MSRALVPLAVFVVIVIFLAIGLGLDPSQVPSPLISKPAPEFNLPQLHAPDESFSKAEMHGKVWLFNVWASWCTACRAEHPLLVKLAMGGQVPIYGLNYKDQREDALRWLREGGDPYVLSAVDANGAVAIDYGVYGVPETYLIDRDGVIRFKQIGPLTAEVLEGTILPMVRELRK